METTFKTCQLFCVPHPCRYLHLTYQWFENATKSFEKKYIFCISQKIQKPVFFNIHPLLNFDAIFKTYKDIIHIEILEVN